MTPRSGAEPMALIEVRRMLEGVVPPTLCTVSAEGVPHVSYLSHAEYLDAGHVALTWQFFNRSRENVLATRRAALSVDDPFTGAGVVMRLAYVRTDTAGPVFERLRAKLAGIAAHTGMEQVFRLRGADVYRVLAVRRVPGRRELPGTQPRCDLAAGARAMSERMAACDDPGELVDATLQGLAEHLRIEHAMLWLLDASRGRLVLLASHGYAASGLGAEIALGEGLAGVAAREGTAIRVGHMTKMYRYGQAVSRSARALGLEHLLRAEVALPGLPEPRSQLAVPLRARGRVAGVLLVESLHDQFFGYDDEDALVTLAAQLASALAMLGPAPGKPQPAPAEPAQTADASPVRTLPADAPSGAALPSAASAAPLRVRRIAHDDTIFLDDEYLVRGVAGAIAWKLACAYVESGRCEFTNRELRAAPELHLPEVQDNLETRLLLLQRRLIERAGPLRIERTARGRFRLHVGCPLVLEETARPMR